MTDHHRVAIIGAGFGGIATFRELRRAGIDDVVVLEREPEVGGTWWVNTYPGCACDVRSHLYSLSWAPNPHWSRSYSGHEEIQRYLRDVSDRIGMTECTRLSTTVLESRWNPEQLRWELTTTGGLVTADILVTAPGPLTELHLPEVPGLAEFPGEVVHTARWPHDLDLRGRRVAVIGTGASAIQVVPGIVDDVAELILFQRTPAWITPRGDRPITEWEQRLFERAPVAQRAVRGLMYARNEALAIGFTRQPKLMDTVSRVARQHIAKQVKDPALREILTPSYRFGCKRILSSDEYYPALQRPNARVIASGLERVEGRVLTASNGETAEVDLVVCATGFDVAIPRSAETMLDGEGVSLADRWHGSPVAYLGCTVSGFPNLFVMLGPNTGLGHTSMVYMIESQARYIADAARVMDQRGWSTVDVRPEVQQAFEDEMGERMKGTVWSNGGCQSWYQLPDGRIPTLWPGFTFEFRRRTRRFDAESYRVQVQDRVSA